MVQVDTEIDADFLPAGAPASFASAIVGLVNRSTVTVSVVCGSLQGTVGESSNQ
jgi:hypothetical protein